MELQLALQSCQFLSSVQAVVGWRLFQFVADEIWERSKVNRSVAEKQSSSSVQWQYHSTFEGNVIASHKEIEQEYLLLLSMLVML